jgi:hypothetical protein
MSSDLKPEAETLAASDYIFQNFEASDRIAILVRSRRSGETLQRITTAKNAASEDFQEWLRHKNVGSDVYVSMNTLKPDAQGRTKDDIETIRHLYLDIDHNGSLALETVENSALVPRPNYVLETSPEKYQVVWKVEGIAQDEAEALQRAMVKEFGGDPAATDSTRVLRLPNFVNRKYGAEHIVRAQPGARQTYHLEDFRLRTDAHEDQREYRPHQSSARTSRGELSQSERDWAFAKRALARGDDPEEVIRRIADYRADEKHPNYARYTVEKAQAALNRSLNPTTGPTERSAEAQDLAQEPIKTP